MKLAVLGEGSETERQFVMHAKKQGFQVTAITKQDLAEIPIAGNDAVVCMPDFLLEQAILAMICDDMAENGVRRLVIVSPLTTDHQVVRRELQMSDIDWTIVQTLSEAEAAIDQATKTDLFVTAKNLATFLLNQITDSRYIQATVLVKN